MITDLSHFRLAVLALGIGSLLAAPLQAAPRVDPVVPVAGQDVVKVQADCYAIGQQVAAENGATLARATASNQGGRPVCVIVIVTPGKDGQRGRRQEIVVPAG